LDRLKSKAFGDGETAMPLLLFRNPITEAAGCLGGIAMYLTVGDRLLLVETAHI